MRISEAMKKVNTWQNSAPVVEDADQQQQVVVHDSSPVQISEVSKALMHRYLAKAPESKKQHWDKADSAFSKAISVQGGDSTDSAREFGRHIRKAKNRAMGIKRARSRVEDVESVEDDDVSQIDELSSGTLRSYIAKASKDKKSQDTKAKRAFSSAVDATTKMGQEVNMQHVQDRRKHADKYNTAVRKGWNRYLGISAAKDKLGEARSYKQETADEGDKHIVMQLRKAVSLRRKDIEFADGKTATVDGTTAGRALQKYNMIARAADKAAFQKKISRSYEALKQAVNESGMAMATPVARSRASTFNNLRYVNLGEMNIENLDSVIGNILNYAAAMDPKDPYSSGMAEGKNAALSNQAKKMLATAKKLKQDMLNLRAAHAKYMDTFAK